MSKGMKFRYNVLRTKDTVLAIAERWGTAAIMALAMAILAFVASVAYMVCGVIWCAEALVRIGLFMTLIAAVCPVVAAVAWFVGRFVGKAVDEVELERLALA